MNEVIHFDIDSSGNFCHGKLGFEAGVITAENEGVEVFRRNLEGIKEILLRTYVGCGTIELVPYDSDSDYTDSIPVCRFSMNCVEEIGEYCKVVNHWIKTGTESEISTKEFRSCPKCGRHYLKGLDTCLFCVEKSYLFKRVAELSRPYMKKMFAASILVLVASTLNVIQPVFYSKIVDTLYYDGSSPVNEIISSIIYLVAAYAGLQILQKIVSIFYQRAASNVSNTMANDLRIMVYDKVQRMNVSSVSKRTPGDLMKRISRDTDVLQSFITEQGMKLLEKVVMFIVILVVLLKKSPFLTLMVFIPVPFTLVFMYKFMSIVQVRYRKQWRLESKSNSILHDIVKGIRVVKTFGSEEREIKKFADVSKKLADTETSNEHMWALVFPFIGFFMGIGEFLVLYFGGRMALDGSLTPGELLQFTVYLTYILQPLRWLSMLPRRLGFVMTSIIKILEVLDEKQDVVDSENPVPAELGGDIVFKDLQFGYRAYEPVLKDINLEIKQGEMIGLVGHSGAGKSTLINLIMRMYDADAGSITIGGRNIKDMKQQEYHSKIGVVFQETFLFNASVYENIAYARKDAEPSEIIAAAKAANAHEFIMNLPDGYNTIIGEDGHNLSGGERQRISIARAVLRNPEILILDEATSALDPETESLIQDALSRLVKGRTTFAIAHRLSTLRNADRLVVIEKGHIAEVGTHKELLLKKGIYSKLVMAQRQTAKLEK